MEVFKRQSHNESEDVNPFGVLSTLSYPGILSTPEGSNPSLRGQPFCAQPLCSQLVLQEVLLKARHNQLQSLRLNNHLYTIMKTGLVSLPSLNFKTRVTSTQYWTGRTGRASPSPSINGTGNKHIPLHLIFAR